VDFVLSLYDDFNGKHIKEGSCSFTVDGKAFMPIKKPDGFYVFCDLGIEEISLKITHAHYHEYSEIFSLDSIDDASFRVKKVKLYRKYSNVHKHCEWYEAITHNVPTNSEVLAFAKVKGHSNSGIADVIVNIDSNNLQILNHNKPTLPLIGRRFTLNPEGINTFTITKKDSLTENYEIEGDVPPPTKSANLYTVYSAMTNLDGVLHIPHAPSESIYKYISSIKNKCQITGVLCL